MYTNGGAMERLERLRTRAEGNGRAVIGGAKPPSVDAVGGQKPLVFEGSCEPGDEGLILGAPGRQGTDPHGHRRLAAVLAGQKPLPAAGTRGVRDADASATAGEGAGHA
jgi:hypothetical protein